MTFEQQRIIFQNRISKVDATTFDKLALDLFAFQSRFNPLYESFLSLLKKDPAKIKSIEEIPFLPISLFKNKTIKVGTWENTTIFESSGTTNQLTSKHEVRSIDWYTKNTETGFKKFYGHPNDFCVLALLPSYLERSGSSLVFMADHFIKQSFYKESGFFLDNHETLAKRLSFLKTKRIPTLLIGVSFGLLDFVENYHIDFPELIVMETGGMKGRRKEMTRTELHAPLMRGFGVKDIHSEYGMTELFSQAYSNGAGRFFAAPTMQILIRDISDPFAILKKGRHGAINIIDLANLDTCAFIATDDIGKLRMDGAFEVLGRLDASDIRGCNLMIGEEG